MATTELPQFHVNDLEPLPITLPALRSALHGFRAAILRAHQLLEADYPAPDPTDRNQFGNIFTGQLGKQFWFFVFMLHWRCQISSC